MRQGRFSYEIRFARYVRSVAGLGAVNQLSGRSSATVRECAVGLHTSTPAIPLSATGFPASVSSLSHTANAATSWPSNAPACLIDSIAAACRFPGSLSQ